jgi:hypothetical protein
MNLLYSPEQDKNSWDYNDEVGFIPKSSEASEHDIEQDQKIEANRQQISETRQGLSINDARDDDQQVQLDNNDALDVNQQNEINSLRTDLETEIQTRANKDTELEDAINAEKTARETADSAEATARENKDTELQSAINAEKTARETKDAEIERGLNAETAARVQKDNELLTAIEAEASSREAKDAEIESQLAVFRVEGTTLFIDKKGNA